jgi:hypothetical protein
MLPKHTLALGLTAGLVIASASASGLAHAQELTRPYGLGVLPMLCRAEIGAGAQVDGTSKDARMEAHHRAIEAWRALVARNYGEAFAQWWKASNKKIDCQADATSTYCKALATPCGNRE